MVDRLSYLASKIDALLRRLDEVDRRLDTLEHRFATLGLPPLGAPATEQPAAADRRFASSYDSLGIASLTGRTFLVLGGGYLLRALTDSGLVARPLGVALGLAYALVWFWMADRDAATRRTLSAGFHGTAAALVAFPLLFEAIVKFQVLSQWGGVVALSAVAVVGLLVAWYRWLHGMAWSVSVAATVTAIALMRATGDVAPFGTHVFLVGLAAFWLGETRGWWILKWPVTITADVIMLWLAYRASDAQTLMNTGTATAVLLAFVVGYLASFAARTLVLGHTVIRFEVFQSITALVVGFGGATYVLWRQGVPVTGLGIGALAVGALTYFVAFWYVEARQSTRNFYYYSSLAIGLVVTGGSLLFPPSVAALLWVALALIGAWLGRRLFHVTLSAHGAIYVAAAAVASGLLLFATHGLLMPVDRPWRDATLVSVLALIGTALVAALLPTSVRPNRSRVMAAVIPARRYVGVPRAIALAILVIGVAGVAVNSLIPLIDIRTAALSGAGLIATVRTAVLAIAIMLMGLLARDNRVHEAGWLVYPLLVAAGLKVLLEDFQQSEAATLFLALVLYGTALIVGPRLAHGRRPISAIDNQ